MHWTEVLGRPMPKKFGGHPALELCNTRAGWGETMRPEYEWIRTYDRLAIWSFYQGHIDETQREELRVSAQKHPAEASATLKNFRGLRESLYSVLTSDNRGDEFDTVADAAQRAAHRMQLVRLEDGGAQWRLPDDTGIDLPLLAAASSAADLLCSELHKKVKYCPGNDCGWLFLDTRGRRRWCSMETCGNRAKARAYAQRRS